MFIQLSADVPVAILMRIAMSGLNEDFSLMNSDRVFRWINGKGDEEL